MNSQMRLIAVFAGLIIVGLAHANCSPPTGTENKMDPTSMQILRESSEPDDIADAAGSLAAS